MRVEQIRDLVAQIKGCTFASIDAETSPSPGLRRVVRREVVILFTNQNSSGYENMVRRRLEEEGKDAAAFLAGDLPWGERVPGTPLIVHNGKYYLQTVLLKPGDNEYYIGQSRLSPEEAQGLFKSADISSVAYGQGLGPAKAVVVRTYKLESLKAIRLQHREVTSSSPSLSDS